MEGGQIAAELKEDYQIRKEKKKKKEQKKKPSIKPEHHTHTQKTYPQCTGGNKKKTKIKKRKVRSWSVTLNCSDR